MPRNSSGVYTLPSGNPVVTRTTILSTWANATMPDIGSELTNSIAKGGQTTPTANLPMGGFRHINVADAQAPNEYSSASQVQSGVILRCTNELRAAGDAYTAQLPFGGTTFINGQMIIMKFPATNIGTTPTLSINGAPVFPILREDGSSIVAGDCRASVPSRLMWNNTAWLLLGAVVSATSVAGVSSFNGRSGIVTLTSADVTGALTYTPVNNAGGTMTGKLTLSGDATANLHAVTLQQLLAQIAAIPGASGVNSWNGRSGVVTMTGTDVVSALGYTPANAATQQFSGNVGAARFFSGDGTAAAPGYTYVNDQTTGFYRPAVGQFGYSSAGSLIWSTGGFGFSAIPGVGYNWYAPGLASLDTGIARNAAGVVEVNNGTPGTLRDLKARWFFASDGDIPTPSFAFASAPTTGFYHYPGGIPNIEVTVGGTWAYEFGPAALSCDFQKFFAWYDAGGAALDTAIGRYSAGTVEINSGVLHDYRDLICRTISLAVDPTFPLQAATKQYVDARVGGGGTSKCQEFTAVGGFTFNVPANVSLIWVTLQAPGGQGGKNASGGGGGGSGELIRHYPYKVTPSGTVSGTIGAGATSSTSVDSTFGTLTAKGGKGGTTTTGGQSGGGPLGGAGGGGAGVIGINILDVLGGSSGGAASTKGGDCGQNSGGNAGGTAGGGGASYWAPGANGVAASVPAQPGVGAGGGGTATGATGGQGGSGYCLIEWIA